MLLYSGPLLINRHDTTPPLFLPYPLPGRDRGERETDRGRGRDRDIETEGYTDRNREAERQGEKQRGRGDRGLYIERCREGGMHRQAGRQRAGETEKEIERGLCTVR